MCNKWWTLLEVARGGTRSALPPAAGSTPAQRITAATARVCLPIGLRLPRTCGLQTSFSAATSASSDGVPGRDEVAVTSSLLQAQLDPPRQQRRTGAQGDRRDRDEHLVQEPGIGELARQVSATDDPDVAAGGGPHHLLVHRCHVISRELDPRIGDNRKLTMREDPARHLVRPTPIGP